MHSLTMQHNGLTNDGDLYGDNPLGNRADTFPTTHQNGQTRTAMGLEIMLMRSHSIQLRYRTGTAMVGTTLLGQEQISSQTTQLNGKIRMEMALEITKQVQEQIVLVRLR